MLAITQLSKTTRTTCNKNQWIFIDIRCCVGNKHQIHNTSQQESKYRINDSENAARVEDLCFSSAINRIGDRLNTGQLRTSVSELTQQGLDRRAHHQPAPLLHRYRYDQLMRIVMSVIPPTISQMTLTTIVKVSIKMNA